MNRLVVENLKERTSMRWSNLLGKLKKSAPDEPRSRPPSIDQMHIYNALWSLPDHVSGMENSALRRMADLEKHGAPQSMTLLTFNPRVDVIRAKARLVGEGRMTEATRVRNIWDYLRQLADEQLHTYVGDKPTDSIPEPTGTPTEEAPYFTAHRNENNRVIRRTYTRADGTTLATHVTTTEQKRFILHDTRGTPLVEWPNPDELYKQWLKRTIAEQPAVLIIDDKKIGEFAHTIPGRTFNTVLFVHGSHLENSSEGPHGPILKARRNTIKNLNGFDLVAVQTVQQRDAIGSRDVDTSNIRIIPSSIPNRAYSANSGHQRDEHAGIVVATLSALKRVDHAIYAARLARKDVADLSLTVCGDGVERDNLESLIDGLSLNETVRLLGQVGDVAERLAASSFSLLTSTSEGHPLVLIESMAAGCIPISYEIAYGPRDIITHGVNGYIVPFGDIDALAIQIQEFVALPDADRSRMRQAAAERALDFGSARSFDRWTDALATVRSNSQPGTAT